MKIHADLQNEKWLKVKFNEAYEISDLGRLRHTFKNGNTKIVVPSHNGGKNNYLFHIIGGNKYYAHQLVLFHFIGNKPDGYECDHINGQRQDNSLVNLRYLPIGENRSHKGESHGRAKLTNRKVHLVRTLFENHRGDGMTMRKLANLFGVSLHSIHAVITRKTWNHI